MPDLEIMADRDVRWARLTELQGLLRTCFPEFLAEQTYYKQVPHTVFLPGPKDAPSGRWGSMTE
jgi:hypothetical protein